ncbi:MAG: hypothetical protein EOP09_15515 [Proteobacteria bacterium]|nr:MAG: hypothetical protein EOP09_15515 [Pseudomonadota bacterium]
MQPEIQKWRDHFESYEAQQLRNFPLNELELPFERAQYEVALKYLGEELQPRDFYLSQPFAFRADDVTRRAFYDFFGSDERRPFCLRHVEWNDVFSSGSARKANSPISIIWHYFKSYTEGDFESNNDHADPIIEEYSPQDLFIRTKGVVRAPRSGYGWTDYWYWDGIALTHLPHWDWSWIS